MHKKICLNMIVKNESPVIRRCLESVKDLIDYWVIVDTGSTDGTQEIIKEYLSAVPGELHERPWVDFGSNRNEAMQLASGKGDYLLFIDADDRLIISENFVMPELEADTYLILQREAFKSVFREHNTIFMIKNDSDYKWEGMLHECLTSPTPKEMVLLPHIMNEYVNDGHRSKDPQKIEKDIDILKKGIQSEPENSRYPFYLARTYWSIKEYEPALKYFQMRAKMGGDPMEVYYSLVYIAICQRRLDYSSEIFIQSFCNAFLYRPSRAEAVYELARYFEEKKNYLLGYMIAKLTMSIPMTTDSLFIESWIYDWGAPLYFFICANGIGAVEEAYAALQKVLAKESLPLQVRKDFNLDLWNAHYLSNYAKQIGIEAQNNNDLQSNNRMVC